MRKYKIVLKAFIALCFIGAFISCRSGKTLLISGDRTLEDDMVIDVGSKIVLSKGATLTFLNGSNLIVRGRMEAIGTTETPVILRMNGGAIRLDKNSCLIAEKCVLQSDTGVDDYYIYANDADFSITDTSFRGCNRKRIIVVEGTSERKLYMRNIECVDVITDCFLYAKRSKSSVFVSEIKPVSIRILSKGGSSNSYDYCRGNINLENSSFISSPNESGPGLNLDVAEINSCTFGGFQSVIAYKIINSIFYNNIPSIRKDASNRYNCRDNCALNCCFYSLSASDACIDSMPDKFIIKYNGCYFEYKLEVIIDDCLRLKLGVCYPDGKTLDLFPKLGDYLIRICDSNEVLVRIREEQLAKFRSLIDQERLVFKRVGAMYRIFNEDENSNR